MLGKISVLLFAMLLIAAGSYAASYQVDPTQSRVEFKIGYMMLFRVGGNFNDFSGNIDIDAANRSLTAAEATIEVNSIDTGINKRDQHLRSADFFDAANHPLIRFHSTSVSGSGEQISMSGNLIIKGVSREIELTGAFVDLSTGSNGQVRARLTAQGSIDRRNFGIVWNRAIEAGGALIGDKVRINLEIEAVRQE